MTTSWLDKAVFYHIYPLGLVGAPHKNDFTGAVNQRFEDLYPWLDHIHSLGFNALYLGPIFESTSHGYDTVDYYQVDRRLGDNQSMARFADAVHQRGMKLVLDGVFNHVGREFWAFKDLLVKGENSAYRDWFSSIRFGERSSFGDPFNYEGWHGHQSLVKLNLSHPHVRAHLFDAIKMWVDRFAIDGLRLDAADAIDFEFLRALHDFTKSLRSDFWLMGEVVHGDYRKWANPDRLDSVTNYQSYKGLYSSLIDGNYFEIAHSLNRQFGPKGIYRDLQLYNFVDNHDVDRVASKLKSTALLFPLYLLLFTMPGIPSVYYGSEWGIEGAKEPWSDAPLRPYLNLHETSSHAPEAHLAGTLQKLISIRSSSKAISSGEYAQLLVKDRQFIFTRKAVDETVIVALNSAPQQVEVEVDMHGQPGDWFDVLNDKKSIVSFDGKLKLALSPTWGMILTNKKGQG